MHKKNKAIKTVYLDGKKIQVPLFRGIVLAFEVRMKLPAEQRTYQMYLAGIGDAPDRLLNDGDEIPDAARIYSVPSACGG